MNYCINFNAAVGPPGPSGHNNLSDRALASLLISLHVPDCSDKAMGPWGLYSFQDRQLVFEIIFSPMRISSDRKLSALLLDFTFTQPGCDIGIIYHWSMGQRPIETDWPD